MIKAPIGGLDMMQMQNIAPAVQKIQPDTGNDFKQAFESAKDTVSKADESTKVNRTEGTGAGGKDSGAAGQTADDSKVKQNNNKAVGADRKDNVSDTSDVKESLRTEDKAIIADKPEQAEEAAFDSAEISKIVEKMILDIAALLGIAPEELNGFLEDMGIKAGDLMVSENINILVADVKGGGDMISLAADADLMEMAANINEAVSRISDKLNELAQGMPEDIVSKAFEEGIEKAVTQLEGSIVSAADENGAAKADANAAPEINADNEITVQAGDLTIEKTVENNDAGNNSNTAEYTGENDAQAGASADRQRIRNDHDRREDMSFTRVDLTDNMEVRPEDVLKADESLKAYGSNTAEVVDQIMEHMKAQVKVDMGSLEMVLHPASLGNVAVNIANNNGGLTAQFTVQNEVVREAIEAQIAVFKENLEQQGVKVEAVEVSVASHGFEENLEQGNEQNNAEEDERERLRRATRKIDLGAFGEEGTEEIDEAEAVTVDMMRSDGNRMNYRV